MNYRKTVVGVIYQNNEFLLVQKPHWKDWWDFPQGGINEGESFEYALMRELWEELGTNEFGKPIYTNITQRRRFSPETFTHYPDKGFVGKELFYFIIPFLGNRNDITLGDDLSDKKWCGKKDLLKIIYKERVDETQKILQFMRLNNRSSFN